MTQKTKYFQNHLLCAAEFNIAVSFNNFTQPLIDCACKLYNILTSPICSNLVFRVFVWFLLLLITSSIKSSFSFYVYF